MFFLQLMQDISSFEAIICQSIPPAKTAWDVTYFLICFDLVKLVWLVLLAEVKNQFKCCSLVGLSYFFNLNSLKGLEKGVITHEYSIAAHNRKQGVILKSVN